MPKMKKNTPVHVYAHVGHIKAFSSCRACKTNCLTALYCKVAGSHSCWACRTESHAGHDKNFIHKLFDIQYPLCSSLLSLIIIIIITITIIIIIIIIIIIVIIIIIIIIIIIRPSKFNSIEGLKKIGTCCLGILFVFILARTDLLVFMLR